MATRKVQPEEIAIRYASGDRSFASWLRSPERRESLVKAEASAVNRALAGYARKLVSHETRPSVLLHVGSGVGSFASAFCKAENEIVRYVGHDYDPQCVTHARRRFGSFSGNEYQFYPTDYFRDVKYPRTFAYVVVSDVFNYLPTYDRLLATLWENCERTLVVAFAKPLHAGPDDVLTLDAGERKLFADLSLRKFREAAERLGAKFSLATVLADVGGDPNHVAALRREDSHPDLTNLHKFAPPGATFPFYRVES